jgi:hypothetical protein
MTLPKRSPDTKQAVSYEEFIAALDEGPLTLIIS